jgi:hypothetical protein
VQVVQVQVVQVQVQVVRMMLCPCVGHGEQFEQMPAGQGIVGETGSMKDALQVPSSLPGIH